MDGEKGIISSYEKYMLKRRMEKEITDIDFLTKEQLKQKVTTILKLVTEFDDHVFEINNIDWTAGSPIPESQQLLDVLLSNNESQFRVFISSLFISFVESMDRAGKSKGKKKYFWKEFKEEYPEIQKVLHKIRLYRLFDRTYIVGGPV